MAAPSPSQSAEVVRSASSLTGALLAVGGQVEPAKIARGFLTNTSWLSFARREQVEAVPPCAAGVRLLAVPMPCARILAELSGR
jgi:hypothetical protein